MKKVLLGILLILPIIIVGVVIAASGIIASLTDLQVDYIILQYDGEAGDSFTVAVGEQGELTAVVYPLKAVNKNYTLNIEDADNPEVEPLATLNQETGEILFRESGELTVYAEAADGGSRSYIVFRIIQQEVSDIYVEKPAGKIEVGDSFVLNAYVLPYEALDKNLTYESSDPSVLQIDRNGFISAKSVGTAEITVTSIRTPEISRSVEIEVSESTPKKLFNIAGNTIISAKTDLDLTDILAVAEPPAMTVTGGAGNAFIEDNTLHFNGESFVTVSAAGFESKNFSYEPANGDIRIKEKDLILSMTNGTRLFMGDKTLYLSAEFAAFGQTGTITWETSDASVATVENGKITPVKDGAVRITAKSGAKSDYIEFTVIQEVSWARLNFNLAKDKESGGIKQSFVWGAYKYDTASSSYVQNTISLGFISVYPAQPLDATLNAKFSWKSSDTSIATVDETGKVTIIPFAEKTVKQVTITATVLYPMYESFIFSVSYTFNINNGIDVTDFKGLMQVTNERKVANMWADIVMDKNNGDVRQDSALLHLFSELNGNGFMFSGGNMFEKNSNEIGRSRNTLVAIRTPEAVIDNVTLRGMPFASDDVSDLKDVRYCSFVVSVGFVDSDAYRRYDGVTIKNSIIENAETGLLNVRGDLNLQGTVFRKFYKTGVFLRTTHYWGNGYRETTGGCTINLHNTVFYDCLLFSMAVDSSSEYNDFDPCHINVSGIYKNYNWRKLDDIPFKSLFGEVEGDFASLLMTLADELINEIGKKEELFKYKDGEPYILIAFADLYLSLFSSGQPMFKPIFQFNNLNEEELPYIMDFINVKVSMSSIRIGANIITLPQDSDYIEIDDTFSPADRQQMRVA